MAVLHLGNLAHDQELILIALTAGMAASGTILLSALPGAAFSYMSGILIPSALKSLLFLNAKGYLLLGVLVLGSWWFLAAPYRQGGARDRRTQADRYCATGERSSIAADTEGEDGSPSHGIQKRACRGAARTPLTFSAWKRGRPPMDWGRTSSHACIRMTASAPPPKSRDSAPRVHPIRRPFVSLARTGGVWLEETGKAEFDVTGRNVRIKGLTCDITERKRAQEQQRLLVREELDHRVKNVLASVGAVAQRTRRGMGSVDEFLQGFDGRIQSMANAHGLLSRSHWQGVSLKELVGNELAPCVRTGGASVLGPDILVSAEAAQPIAIVLHELVTNTSKSGHCRRSAVRSPCVGGASRTTGGSLVNRMDRDRRPRGYGADPDGLWHPLHSQPYSLRTRRRGDLRLRSRGRALHDRSASQTP